MEKKTWPYYGIQVLGWVLQLLPYTWLLALGGFLGGLAAQFSGRHRERGVANARMALGIDEGEARKLIKEMYKNFGKNALELLYSNRMRDDSKYLRKIIEFAPSEEFSAWRAKGSGGMFVSAHYGNWEWMLMRIAAENMPVGTIVKSQPQPWLNALLNKGRRRNGGEVFTRTKSGKEVLAAIRRMKQGMYLGLLCDQAGGPDGFASEFFGQVTSTMSGPGIIAVRSGIPVFPVFIYRRPGGGHRLIVGNLLPETKDPVVMTQNMQKVIEEQVRKKPDEWLWLQRRWQAPVSVKEGDEE